MINCESMTDRMPVVAHGRAEWTREEEAHLAECQACAAEWRLIATARRLGDSAAGRLTPDSVGRAVVGQLTRERRHRLWRRAGVVGSLAAAALVVLLVWGTAHRGITGGTTGVVAGLQLPLAELEGLDEGELTAVLEGMEAPLGGGASPEAPALGDLQNSELERVLRSLEG
jgi:anti-sigma factor RsiW